MDKNKKIPEVRFKGFEDEWENMDASVIFKTYFDKNHPDLPVLSASQEYGMIVRENVGFKVQHNKDGCFRASVKIPARDEFIADVGPPDCAAAILNIKKFLRIGIH